MDRNPHQSYAFAAFYNLARALSISEWSFPSAGIHQ